MDRAAWIRTDLLPSLLAQGKLSSDPDGKAALLSCEVIAQGDTGDHFASSVYFVNLQLNTNGNTRTLNIIVKMELADEFLRTLLSTKELFANEVVMYKYVLPTISKCIQTLDLGDLFPVCYDVHTDPDGGSYIVLQNLKTIGFSLCEGIFLDYEKCVVALLQLGRFHGLAYACKKRNPEEFFSLIDKLVDPRYNSSSPKPNPFLTPCALRGIRYAKSQATEGPMINFLSKMEDQVTDAVALMQKLVRPEEPLAVLCHGDFCRNNFFFRFSASYEMKMFDLQTARYSSPAIDTAFFAFMSTTAELRKEHWDSLFQCYHNTVVKTLSQVLKVTIEDLGPEFSLQSFQEDFAKHALYGYMLCSFFLPVMSSNVRPPDIQEVTSQSPEVTEQILVSVGGEPATKLLAGIVTDIIEINTAWVRSG